MPSSRDLPNTGTELAFLTSLELAGRLFTTSATNVIILFGETGMFKKYKSIYNLWFSQSSFIIRFLGE